MNWPWQRFEEFYEAARKRSVIEGMEQRKEQMIAALWANSNYDPAKQGDASPRVEIIEAIEHSHAQAVRILHGFRRGQAPATQGAVDDQPEGLSPENDPFGFFAAGKRGEAKLYAKLENPMSKKATVEDVISTEGTDQS